MELSPRLLLLIALNVLFNLYTLSLLSHSYSIKSSSSSDCSQHSLSTITKHLLPTTNPTALLRATTSAQQDADMRKEIDMASEQNPPPTSSPSTTTPIASKAKIGKTSPKVQEFVVMIPSAERPGGAFYLQQCVDALLRSGVSGSAISVMNMDAGANPKLHAYMAALEERGQRVELLERRYAKKKEELRVPDLREFPFAVKPAELKSEGYEVAVKDNVERKVWRSKEAIDFVVLSRKMLLAHPETQWFVFLQDDAVLHRTVTDLYATLRSLVEKYPLVSVFHLNKWGNVAIMFHRHFLESFMAYANLRFDLMPIDWLLSHQKVALGTKDKVLNLFSHVGLKSSFVQNDRSDLIN